VTGVVQFRFASASCSHVGLVREVNEDACLDQPERGLWAVADGMGGHAIGDVASRMVIDALNHISPSDNLVSLMGDARQRLLSVNRQLRAEAALRNVQLIGSTVVVLLACDDYCGWMWAGDSRLYLYRDGRLRPLTRDHSRIEELKSSGYFTADNPLRNVITRAVGARDMLGLEVETMQINHGDIFLLCSDGLSNALSDEEIAGALISGDCQQASNVLIELALQRGGRDNISVVVVSVEDIYGDEKTVLNPAL
jgi:protein phosphatase